MSRRNLTLWAIGLVLVTCSGSGARPGQASAAGSGGAADVQDPWAHQPVAPYYFAVSVEDVDQAVAWYRQALGLELLDDTSAKDGAWRIANLRSDVLSVEIIRDRRDVKLGRAKGFAKVGFAVSDVEKVAERVEQAIGERPRIVDFKAHQIRILQLRDPEGNVIQLSSPMSAE